MTRIRIVAVVLLLAAPAAAHAQNREHLQITADLRMLQEQVSRLQLALNQLADQQKAIARRLDDQVAATQKAFADQQLLINNQAATVNAIRESIADNTTRVNQVMEELTSMRKGFSMLTEQLNTLVGLLQPPGNAPADASAGAPGGQTGPLGSVEVPESPTRIFNAAMGDYMSSNHMENAIDGFNEFLQKYPNSPQASEAQFFLGEAYFSSKPGKFKEAIDAYGKLIANYKDSPRVPEAYYKQALSYQNLGQRAEQVRILQLIVKQYPESNQALLAAQELKRLGVTK
jgi:tol-pal system protein YbgF